MTACEIGGTGASLRGLFVASLIAFPLLAPGARIPNPFGPDAASRVFFLNNPSAVRMSDLLQLIFALCFAAASASMSSTQTDGVKLPL
jgi:hypothetical protein